MPSQMAVYAFQDYLIGVGPLASVTEAFITQTGYGIADSDPTYLERAGQPHAFTQSDYIVSEFQVLFKFSGYAAKTAILQMLDWPHVDAERVIQVYAGDSASPTLCQQKVTVKSVEIGLDSITAVCHRARPWWESKTNRQLGDISGGGTVLTANSAFCLINNGHVRTPVRMKLGWSAQRAGASSSLGWKYTKRVTITNSTTRAWTNEPTFVDLGDTAALVTGSKALASGNDLRIWFEGQEYYRTLINWNTKRTFVCFLVNLASGDSATFDCVYGNASAGTPRNLSTRTATRQTYVAYDLEGYSGTLTAGSTTTATDGGASWETNRWAGGWIGFLSGTGSVRWRRIKSNTGTVITLNRALNTAVDNTTTYVIVMSGVFMDGGRITTAGTTTNTDNAHTDPWGTNELAGATITFHGGTASPSTATIASNTGTTFTLSAALSVAPTVGDSYTIQRLGKVSYVVSTSLNNTTHRGLYRENTYYTKPTRIWWNGDTPGGWMPETYLPNDDDYGQRRAWNSGSGGGHALNYWPTWRPQRRVRQTGKLPDEGTGDGMAYTCAYGLQSWYFDYKLQNENGVGQAVFSCLDLGGEDWQDVVTDSTTHASITAVAAQWVDLSGYDNPTRIFAGVLPTDGVEIPTTQSTADDVELRNGDVMQLVWDLDAFGGLTSSQYVVGSETAFYELGATLRMGGGELASPTAPYDTIELGGDGHRVVLLDDTVNESLWITVDPEDPLPVFVIYNEIAQTWTPAAWAGLIKHYEPAGSPILTTDDVALQSGDFPKLRPALNFVTNGSFLTGITGWTVAPGAGVTVAASWDSTVSADRDYTGSATNGSLKLHITVTPGGAWTITCTIAQIALVPGNAYDYGFAVKASATGASIRADETIIWAGGTGEANDTIGGALSTSWQYFANGNYANVNPPGYAFAVDETDSADISIVVSGSGSYTGDVYLDMVTLGVPNLSINEPNMGTLVVEFDWLERLLA